MANSEQKTPFALSLSRFSERKVLERIQTLGQSLPASVVSVDGTGTIVTVQFEVQSEFTLPQITCPLFGPEYIRYPIQAGDKGAVFPVGAYMGGMSGLGGGVADLTQRANLSTLVFFPCGNKNFAPTDDANAVVIYGPDGVIIRPTGGQTKITLKTNGDVVVHGNLKVDGEITAKDGTGNFVTLTGHEHTQGNDSHDDTEVQTNPPVHGL